MHAGLSELLHSAAVLLECDAIGDVARLRLVAHCVREIRNRLLLQGVSEHKSRLDYRDRVAEIARQLGPEWPAPASGEQWEDEHAEVSIPLPAATALRDLLIEHEEVSVLNRDRARRAFHYHLDTDDPSVDAVADRWFDTGEWFVQRAHDGDGDVGDDCARVNEQFELFLAGLTSLVAGFFEIKREIDDIVDAANT